MKYKIFIGVIILIMCITGCSNTENIVSNTEGTNLTEICTVDEEAIRRQIAKIFDIENSVYSVVNEENGLSPYMYGGSYKVVINIDKDNINAFFEDLNTYYFRAQEVEGYEDMGENVYMRIGNVKRTIKNVSVPKTCIHFITCIEKDDGGYRVYMEYLE